MAEISLRAYIKQINDMVENENLDEAIAHCRYILQTYPKHLEIYRLLGKAYLEANRYGDATDILQRVLSAVPDDFVAHVGMSIVREDEGNIDAAIWHMERAFETNPANPVIQQELRRLVGRRDGLEPHKVRLTRGALARMYAHGELYQQAIAELRSALQEEPDRPDLQVQLAEMYWRLNQPSESMTVCKVILDHLPFCLEANKLTAAHLKATGKHDKAAPYHRRIASLDPYLAFLDSPLSDPGSIDASTINIERLEWHPGQPVPTGDPGQPSWAASLGVDLVKDEAEPAARPAPPELDKALGAAAISGVVAAGMEGEEPAPAAEPQEDGTIPDWMKDAGWVEASGEAVERPVDFTDAELSDLDAGVLPPEQPAEREAEAKPDLTPAEIPSWLQDIAPGDVESMAEEGESGESQAPDWLVEAQASGDQETPEDQEFMESLQAVSAAADDDVFTPETEKTPPDAEEGKEVPTWLDQEPPGATETIVTWLGDRGPSEEAKITPAEAAETADAPSDQPLAESEDEPVEEIPTWLEEAVADEPGLSSGQPTEEEQQVETPGWLAGVAEAAAEDEGTSPLELDQFREQFDYSETGEDEFDRAEAEEPAPSPGEVPDWLQAISVSDEAIESVTADEVPDEEVAAPSPSEMFEVMDDEESIEARLEAITAEPEPEVEEEALDAEPAERVPDWLESVSADESEIVEPESETELEAPAWLQGLDEAEEEEIAEAEDVTAPDWLQGIAVDEGQAGDDQEAGPEWLSGIADDVETAEEPASAEPAESDWLGRLSEIGKEDSDEITLSSDAPEWLSSLAGSEAADAIQEQVEPEAPDRMEEIAAEADVQEADLSELEGILPPDSDEPERQEGEDVEIALDWLKESVEEVSPEPPEFVEPPQPEAQIAVPPTSGEIDDEEIMDWLDGLAATQESTDLEDLPEFAAETAAGDQPVLEPDRVEIPDEPDEGLEWLEQLAAERGIDIDVSYEEPPVVERTEEEEEQPAAHEPQPEQIAPEERPADEVAPPEPVIEEETAEEPQIEPEVTQEPPPSTVPDWLIEMSAAEREPGPAPSPVEPETSIETERIPESDEERPAEYPPQEVEPALPAAEEQAAPAPPPAYPDEVPVEPPAEAPAVPPTRESDIDAPAIEVEAELEQEPPEEDMLESGGISDEIAAAVPLDQLAKPEPEPERTEPEEELDLSVPEWLRRPPEEISPTAEEPVQAPPAAEAPVEPPIQPDVISPPEIPSAEPELAPPSVEDTISEPIVEPEPPPPSEVVEPPVAPIRVPEPQPEPEGALPQEPIELTEPVAPAEAEDSHAPAEPIVVPTDVETDVPAQPITPEQKLELPRKELAAGNIENAVLAYAEMIKDKDLLDLVIDDLRIALERQSENPSLWQTLGDAYMNKDQLSEAIEAYRRGMETA